MKNSLTNFKKFEIKTPNKISGGGELITWIEEEYELDGTHYIYACYMDAQGWTGCSTFAY